MTSARPTHCEPYLYFICRRDLPNLSHLIVQLLHAAHQFGSIYKLGQIPNVVLLEPVADRQELDLVSMQAKEAQVPHYVYSETYQNWGMTAMAALARTEEERAVFKGFKKWNLNSPLAQPQSDQPLKLGDAGASPAGRANFVPKEEFDGYFPLGEDVE